MKYLFADTPKSLWKYFVIWEDIETETTHGKVLITVKLCFANETVA